MDKKHKQVSLTSGEQKWSSVCPSLLIFQNNREDFYLFCGTVFSVLFLTVHALYINSAVIKKSDA